MVGMEIRDKVATYVRERIGESGGLLSKAVRLAACAGCCMLACHAPRV